MEDKEKKRGKFLAFKKLKEPHAHSYHASNNISVQHNTFGKNGHTLEFKTPIGSAFCAFYFCFYFKID